MTNSYLSSYTRTLDYDRGGLLPAVVHLGLGRFARAHLLDHFDTLARHGSGWGVVGVSLRHPDVRDALRPQDNLYTLVEKGTPWRARMIGVLTEVLYAPEDPTKVVEALAAPTTELVTTTVTRKGYRLGGCGGIELGAELQLSAPASVPGYLMAALELRRRRGHRGLTLMSCDNFPGNGRLLRDLVLKLANVYGRGLDEWIQDHVTFPSTMVDRITPKVTAQDRAGLWKLDVECAAPVLTEPFSQWVVEDSWGGRRPPLELAGVQLVEDVEVYQRQKTRLVDGTISALVQVGLLLGHRTAKAALDDPLVEEYLNRLAADEIAPLVEGAGTHLGMYQSVILDRLRDRSACYELSGLDDHSRLEEHLLPSLQEALGRGMPSGLLGFAFACRVWSMCQADASPVDELAPRSRDPRAVLEHPSLELVQYPETIERVLALVDQIRTQNARGVLFEVLAQGSGAAQAHRY